MNKEYVNKNLLNNKRIMKNKILGQISSKCIAEGGQFVRNRYQKLTLRNPRQDWSRLIPDAHNVDT